MKSLHERSTDRGEDAANEVELAEVRDVRSAAGWVRVARGLTDAETAPPCPGLISWPYTVARTRSSGQNASPGGRVVGTHPKPSYQFLAHRGNSR